MIMKMFVNKNDGLQIKIIFADNSYKQQMLINILQNENYKCKFKSIII